MPDETEEEFPIWPENIEIVSLFIAVMSQWRTSAHGVLIGLDYGPVNEEIREGDYTLHRSELMSGIRIMEAAMKHEINRSLLKQ